MVLNLFFGTKRSFLVLKRALLKMRKKTVNVKRRQGMGIHRETRLFFDFGAK